MPRIMIAHPSSDVYGSDLQLLQTVRALIEAGWEVAVCVPGPGPLNTRLQALGASVTEQPFPVLRKAALRPRALPGFLVDALRTTWRLRRSIRSARPDCLLVNTLTLPTWTAGGRFAGVRTVVHSHEAEQALPRILRAVITAPLLMAHRVIANSQSTREALVGVVSPLAARTVVVYNGVDGPDPVPAPVRDRVPDDSATIVCVGRISERKGTDIALEAVATLRGRGKDVRLRLAGSVFEGYEWFEERLRERAAQPDLAGAVDFLGYTDPWAALESCDVAVVPSHGESFGNVAVEALLARRPLVASDVQGLAEIVRDGRTGLLVPPGEVEALAEALGTVLDDPVRARTLAEAGRADVVERFSGEKYRQEIVRAIEA